MIKVPIEVSARHCHLSEKDLQILFGAVYKLKPVKQLSQPGQFAGQEEVIIVGPKGELKVRVVGPCRPQSQVELSATDFIKIGLKPILKVSGNLSGSLGGIIKGPKGKVSLKQGIILAQRHLHLSPKEAQQLKLKNGQTVSIKISGPRALTFDKVAVRVGIEHAKSFQIDTDEGNACGWQPGMMGQLIK